MEKLETRSGPSPRLCRRFISIVATWTLRLPGAVKKEEEEGGEHRRLEGDPRRLSQATFEFLPSLSPELRLHLWLPIRAAAAVIAVQRNIESGIPHTRHSWPLEHRLPRPTLTLPLRLPRPHCPRRPRRPRPPPLRPFLPTRPITPLRLCRCLTTGPSHSRPPALETRGSWRLVRRVLIERLH